MPVVSAVDFTSDTFEQSLASLAATTEGATTPVEEFYGTVCRS